MSAISGTRRALKELVDGTIRVQIDIDPRFKAEFHKLFPTIDMPVALAPLASDFEQKEEKPKIGPLCLLAVRWCKDDSFYEWYSQNVHIEDHEINEQGAASYIKFICGIESRKELDTNQHAASIFNHAIRTPYMEWLKRNPA